MPGMQEKMVAFVVLLFIVLLFPMFLACMAASAEDPAESSAGGTSALKEKIPGSAPPKELSWFILPAMINVYPKMGSEEFISGLYDPAMRLIAPGFRNVRTIGSLRDEYLLWTPDFSIGKVLSPHIAAYIHFGYSAGKVRSERTNTSIFLLPLYTDFEIYRSAAYVGLCADIFPWGMPEQKKYDDLWECLGAARPSLGLRFTETYAGYKAKIKNGFFKSAHFLDIHLSDSWWVPTSNINVGVDIPLNNRSALTMNVGYNIAFSRGVDFSGMEFTVGWKHFFK
jgi:hypothetical protein